MRGFPWWAWRVWNILWNVLTTSGTVGVRRPSCNVRLETQWIAFVRLRFTSELPTETCPYRNVNISQRPRPTPAVFAKPRRSRHIPLTIDRWRLSRAKIAKRSPVDLPRVGREQKRGSPPLQTIRICGDRNSMLKHNVHADTTVCAPEFNSVNDRLNCRREWKKHESAKVECVAPFERNKWVGICSPFMPQNGQFSQVYVNDVMLYAPVTQSRVDRQTMH